MYKIIEELCEEHGISPAFLAREVGISKSTFSELKSGRTASLSAKNMEKIASYFGIPVDRLLGEPPSSEEKKPLVNNDEELTEYLEELRTRPEMKMLFQLTSKATKADVEKAVRIIEAMLREE